MKRIFAILLMLGLLALTGCTAPANAQTGDPDVPPQPEHSEPAEIQPLPGEQADPQEESDPLEGLVRDQYEDLVISAVVLPRMAILPGSAVPVTVRVENTGERTVTYVLGSGSYQTPDALLVQSQSLQPVLFRDRVGGFATMDYVTKELNPGETLEYTVYVMAVEPLESFREITYALYQDQELYIADADPQELRERYPEITPVQPGSHTVQVSFVYGLAEEGEDGMPVYAPTSGYAQAQLEISVTD